MAKSSSYNEYNALQTQLKDGQISPVYLLHGEEYYFLDELLKTIENSVLEEATKSFNQHVFYGKDANVLDIINVCRRFPMMAEKQLVVVKEAQQLRKPELILPYLEQPLESTVLVWFHPGKKLPMNRKLGMAFKKKTMYTATPVSDKEMSQVVTVYVQQKGYDIEPKPLMLLIENSGGKFSVIVSELEKVFSNLEEGNKIREEHIEKYVGINKEYNLFELQKALAKKNKAQVLEIVNHFMANIGSYPLPLLLGVLFNYFKKVAIMQSLRGKTDKEIMSILGIPFFAIAEYRQAANNFRGEAVSRVIGYLNDCDLKMKGIKESTGKEKELLQELVLKIISH